MKIKLLMAAVLVMAGSSGATVVPAAAAFPAGMDRVQVMDRLERPAKSMQELQTQIDLQLMLAPGGRQSALNEVSYEHGMLVVTYPMPGASALGVPDCPSGWFCFYDNTSWNYPRGRLSDCGWQNLNDFGWSDRTESVHNPTGNRVEYINHQDFGNPANGHSYDQSLFFNSPGSAISSVPFRNSADHVSRRCQS
jgi:hypothetical protein